MSVTVSTSQITQTSDPFCLLNSYSLLDTTQRTSKVSFKSAVLSPSPFISTNFILFLPLQRSWYVLFLCTETGIIWHPRHSHTLL